MTEGGPVASPPEKSMSEKKRRPEPAIHSAPSVKPKPAITSVALRLDGSGEPYVWPGTHAVALGDVGRPASDDDAPPVATGTPPVPPLPPLAVPPPIAPPAP